MLKNIAVFVSGSGSNLQSLIDACKDGRLKGGLIRLVIAGKPGIYALERAKQAGISAMVFEKSAYPSLSDMFEEIIRVLKENNIDLIVLAGYLTILTPNILNAFRNKIINIHPSLIPNFCGDGYYGIRVHEAVIAAREKISGATVHYVDEGTDTGQVILQKIVPVLEDDTPESLQKRVLAVEHKLLPMAVQKIITGENDDKKSVN